METQPPFIHGDVVMLMYFSILFGFLGSYINCDLQRMLQNNPYFVHLLGFMCMVFIYITQDFELSTLNIIGRAIGMYILYLFATKSKWYFGILTIVLLLIYGIIRRDFLISQRNSQDEKPSIEQLSKDQQRILFIIRLLMLFSILFGMLQYIFLQKKEYKQNFSWTKFFLGTGSCKAFYPQYT